MRFTMVVLLVNVLFMLTMLGTEYHGAESNPTGDPIGGAKGYSDIFSAADATDPAYVVDTKAALLSALSSAGSGDVIFVDGDIDLSGESDIVIPAGVTLAGDRGTVNGNDVSSGAVYQYPDQCGFSLAQDERSSRQNYRIADSGTGRGSRRL